MKETPHLGTHLNDWQYDFLRGLANSGKSVSYPNRLANEDLPPLIKAGYVRENIDAASGAAQYEITEDGREAAKRSEGG